MSDLGALQAVYGTQCQHRKPDPGALWRPTRWNPKDTRQVDKLVLKYILIRDIS